jgi:hypothetical protein
VQEVIEINDDKELYEFIDDLDEDIIAGFSFPLVLKISGGDEITVHDQKQLEDLIEEAIGSCDEDDNNDFDDDDIDDSDIKSILMEGSWFIAQFRDEGKDRTSLFEGYVFVFKSNGKVEATTDNTTVIGEWSSNGDSGELEIEIEFENSEPLEELEDDWHVQEYNEGKITLVDDFEGDDDSQTLVFERI